MPATDRAVVLVNGRVACLRGKCTAYQGQFADGYVRLSVPGGRTDVIVLRAG